jgi:hypothetical protein
METEKLKRKIKLSSSFHPILVIFQTNSLAQ